MKKVVSCLLVAWVVMGLVTVAFSQEYPTKPVTLVCGMDPGGVVDVATRVLVDGTKKIFGQDILVENKPGASHMVAASYVVNSKPDGYTLFTATDAPFVRAPHMMKLKFDPITEMTPIIFYGIFTHFVVVPADSPFKTLKDMLLFAKQNPGKLTFGNAGFGQVPHLAMESMALETGMKITHVPFAGENKEIAALLGGHLMAAGIAIESSISQVQAGKLRALGILQGDAAPQGVSRYPDLEGGGKGIRHEIERELSRPAACRAEGPAGTHREEAGRCLRRRPENARFPEIRHGAVRFPGRHARYRQGAQGSTRSSVQGNG